MKAADSYDEAALSRIFGPEGDDIVFTGEVVQDRQHATNFAKEAHEKMKVTTDPQSGNRAFLLVGSEDWPFPVPMVKSGQNGTSIARPALMSFLPGALARTSWTRSMFAMGTSRRRWSMP